MLPANDSFPFCFFKNMLYTLPRDFQNACSMIQLTKMLPWVRMIVCFKLGLNQELWNILYLSIGSPNTRTVDVFIFSYIYEGIFRRNNQWRQTNMAPPNDSRKLAC